MRSAFALLFLVSAGIGLSIVVQDSSPDSYRAEMDTRQQRRSFASAERVTDFAPYRDEDYSFSLAVPAGWKSIVTMAGEPGDRHAGYAVGFEAPPDRFDDRFADYVMIEILPGDRSGRFLTDGTRALPVTVDGLRGVRERLAIDGVDLGEASLDLIVLQAEVTGLGFTVGFYAIGEPEHRALLEGAFELMIRTFELDRPPFRIS